MSITYEEDTHDVERIEDDCINTLSGLELLGRARATVVNFDKSTRQPIEDAIVNSGVFARNRKSFRSY